MSTYMIANCTIKDPKKFAEYGALAGPTFAPHGGTLIQKGKLDSALDGEPGADVTAIFSFADPDSAKGGVRQKWTSLERPDLSLNQAAS